MAKQAFEAEQRQHNADVNFLKDSFEMCEEGAIEKYASVVLATSAASLLVFLDATRL